MKGNFIDLIPIFCEALDGGCFSIKLNQYYGEQGFMGHEACTRLHLMLHLFDTD